ncbi:hypothetical protein OBBRIDRAFT_338693 [Obba rivulosa]|uniref:Uncharacterized protein n=1 Tax=Obba rivulosa TaxID=1052685 RepID=A0A8E2DPB6_9APHY|nr:hypothetical protein OBBRIDRAFT_338693 [Obba rivulosa]
MSENSNGRDSPGQRVSFESDHPSVSATVQNLRQAVATKLTPRSEPILSSPSMRGDGSAQGHTPTQTPRLAQVQNLSPRPAKESLRTASPTSRSPSQSRAVSPFRRFGISLHRAHSREEPFVPVDPFSMQICWFDWRRSERPLPQLAQDIDAACDDTLTGCLPLPVLCGRDEDTNDREGGGGASTALASALHAFFVDTLARQLYLTLLLRIPALYWSRVARVFEDAELSKPDVQRMVDACTPDLNREDDRRGPYGHHQAPVLPFPEDWNPSNVSHALVRFKQSWELFVDSLMREWKTLNLVSALLCTAILTMFQIEDAADDPLTRSASLFSLVFGLMSLSYGCVYIVHFGTMRSMDRASRWAEEAQKSKTAIWWNIWVLLATPAVWLAWSMISFCVAILAFVWRTGSSDDPHPRAPLSPRQALGVRIAITTIFALGLVNFVMIIRTFKTYTHTADIREGRRARRAARAEAAHNGGRGRDAAPQQHRNENFGSQERAGHRASDAKESSMVGLGLVGLGENSIGSPSGSLGGLLRDGGDPEKTGGLPWEKGRRTNGTISPKL